MLKGLTLTGNNPRVFISKFGEDLPEEVDIVSGDSDVMDVGCHGCSFLGEKI